MLINYIFIKIYLFPMLRDDNLTSSIRAAIRRNPKNRKIILINGRKMKICLVILYEMLNVIFEQNNQFKTNANKHIKKELRVKKLKDLVHNFVFGNK